MSRLLKFSFYALCGLLLASVLVYNFVPGVQQYIKGNIHAEAERDKAFYRPSLDSISALRKTLAKDKADLKKLKQQFVKVMIRQVFPYWYGTSWNFYGTTQTPNEGKIACGYFVTTTLRDAGVKIEREKMAQCASEEMIRSLVAKKNIYHLGGISHAEFQKKLTALGDGLYVIGLDNHTGFIFLEKGKQYFIHASGLFPFKVIREPIGESIALQRSKYKVLGKISDDEGFLKKWIGKS